MKSLTAFLILALLFIAQNTQAWSSAGHQVIAAETYRQLSPARKTKVTETLKSHPDYENWKDSFTGDSAKLDLGMFIFMRASTWPDDIRRRKSEYNHPKWHYVDYPLKPPNFPFEPGPDPADDILYGFGQCEKVLRESSGSWVKRSLAPAVTWRRRSSEPVRHPALLPSPPHSVGAPARIRSEWGAGMLEVSRVDLAKPLAGGVSGASAISPGRLGETPASGLGGNHALKLPV